MNRVTKNSIFNVIYSTLNLLFPLIIIIYVSRILMPEGIGKVATAQNFASYFVILATLGLPTYGIRTIAKVQNNKDELNKTYSELMTFNILFSIFSSIVYVIVILVVPGIKNDFLLYLVCGIQVIFSAINNDWFYKGREDYCYIVIRSLIVKTLSLIAVFIFVRTKNDYIIYALITNLALVGNYLFNIFHARKFASISFKNLNLKPHIKPLAIFTIIVIFSTIYSKIDITMLSIMKGDEIVGYYVTAHKTIEFVLAITTAISAVYLPRLSAVKKENDITSFSELVKKGTNVTLAIALPASVGICVLAPFAIYCLYGNEFSRSTLSLQLFSLLILIRSIGDFFCYQCIVALEKENKRILITIIGSLLNCLINFLLIPSLAEIGAVIATLITELIINVYLFIFVIKFMHFKFPLKELLKCVAASGIMGGIVYSITLIPVSNAVILTIGIILGIIIYFILGLLFRINFVMNIKNYLFTCFKKIRKKQ